MLVYKNNVIQICYFSTVTKKEIDVWCRILDFLNFQLTFCHSGGDSLTNSLITVFVEFWAEGCQEPHNMVGSLSPAEHLAGFEPGTFQFLLQCLNPPEQSP